MTARWPRAALAALAFAVVVWCTVEVVTVALAGAS